MNEMPTHTPTVVLGVTGCIAAYKACEIVRSLQRRGCRVKVVMTENATRFVGEATFKALTREPVAVSLFDTTETIHHISLAEEADVFVVAPATANVLAKLATGRADDLLSTTALATEAPIVIAPAMNVHMWQAEATRANLQVLLDRGVRIVEPIDGMLACGYTGTGKLAEVDVIVEAVMEQLDRTTSLAGVGVLVTAGPTHEPIDPVRYLGNRSSGITGYAIAEEAAARGAEVVLVTGPTSLPTPFGVRRVPVETAEEMFQACRASFDACDIAVFSAAVSDYRVVDASEQKLKKSGDDGLVLELVQNIDILATLASEKDGRFVVGFAAETENVLESAREKLERKGADLIVANDVSDSGMGFGTPHNKVWLVDRDGVEELPVSSKRRIASALLDKIIAMRPRLKEETHD